MPGAGRSRGRGNEGATCIHMMAQREPEPVAPTRGGGRGGPSCAVEAMGACAKPATWSTDLLRVPRRGRPPSGTRPVPRSEGSA